MSTQHATVSVIVFRYNVESRSQSCWQQSDFMFTCRIVCAKCSLCRQFIKIQT